ncbi:MAG: adenylate/guanylate cyclase domain-containing protein [Arenicellales bacterium]|nr:adenylate/guanylate cyclase domain-containing protein [Arenicellales bacterium]
MNLVKVLICITDIANPQIEHVVICMSNRNNLFLAFGDRRRIELVQIQHPVSSDMNDLPRKLAVILHADVVGSTGLVQRNEEMAHRRIDEAFSRFSETIAAYNGVAHEVRGDAVVAEFERASDAVCAALAFQVANAEHNKTLADEIRPEVRVGISLGEVIIADGKFTGVGVVLAQRVEQLAEPGGVCITGAIHEALPGSMPFDQESLGEREVKGFEETVKVYAIRLSDGAELPPPADSSRATGQLTLRWLTAVATVLFLIGGGLLAWFQPWAPKFEPAAVEDMAFPLPDKPSIAVLPFDNYSDEEQLGFFADGLTENITSALSKAPGLFVIARNTATTYKGKPINVKQVAEDLGIQYVLEGSVQKSGEQLRITVQLVDAVNGHHLWTDRFDRAADDVFVIQDEITKRVITELQVELTEGENARIAARSTNSLQAWLLRTEGYGEFIKFTRESQVRARELFQAAHEADPDWALPLSSIALTHWYEARMGFSKSRDESIRLGIEAAERAIELQPDEFVGYFSLGNLMALINEPEKGIELRRKAMELAPNSFNTVAGLAIRLSEADQEQEAVELFERAIRLSPKHPWWIEFGYGFALHLVGRKEDAIKAYKQGINSGAKSPHLLARLAAVYADLGRMDEAKAMIDDALRIDSQFTTAKYFKSYPLASAERNDWYEDLLIRSGLPEYPSTKLPDESDGEA